MSSYVAGGLFSHTSLGDYSSLSSSTSVSGCSGKIENVLWNYYLNNLHTDIEFKVHCGDSFISFRCHKLVLSIRSPVFADKFYGPRKTTREEIDIIDVSPSAFEVLIKHFYGFNEDLKKNRNDTRFLLKVLKAAKIYEVNSLEDECRKTFSASVPNLENVFELLDAAALIDSEPLKLKCLSVLQRRTAEVISACDIFSVTPTVLNTILDLPVLSLNSEYEVIAWLFEWGSYNYVKYKNKSFKEIMAPYLSKINLMSLEPQQFGMLVKKYRHFFDEKEAFAIFMNIVCPDCEENLPSWCSNTESKRSFNQDDESL